VLLPLPRNCIELGATTGRALFLFGSSVVAAFLFLLSPCSSSSSIDGNAAMLCVGVDRSSASESGDDAVLGVVAFLGGAEFLGVADFLRVADFLGVADFFRGRGGTVEERGRDGLVRSMKPAGTLPSIF